MADGNLVGDAFLLASVGLLTVVLTPMLPWSRHIHELYVARFPATQYGYHALRHWAPAVEGP
jgi:hypothetical protein